MSKSESESESESESKSESKSKSKSKSDSKSESKSESKIALAGGGTTARSALCVRCMKGECARWTNAHVQFPRARLGPRRFDSE